MQANVGRAEMEILQYIVEHHPVTVRDVALHLEKTKGQTRTTALNVMERLRKKGYLTRQKQDKVFVYSPIVPKPQMLRLMVGDFMERVLGGSLKPFTAYLAQDATLSDDEVSALRRLVDELETQRRVEPQDTSAARTEKSEA